MGSIPVLLLAKPLTIRSRMKKAAARHDSFSSESQLMAGEHNSSEKVDNGHGAAGGDHGGHEEHDFSEIVIHQVQYMCTRNRFCFSNAYMSTFSVIITIVPVFIVRWCPLFRSSLDGAEGDGLGGSEPEIFAHDVFAAHHLPNLALKAIETIEFVLGMVSNTASYLRLWALSLAHTELAAVFWEKTMLTTIQMGNAFAIFIGFAMFAGVTFGVILCMDVLECFLHALRLHWVEFQTKFYKADG